MAKKKGEVKLNKKVYQYFDLYQTIDALKVSGRWEQIREIINNATGKDKVTRVFDTLDRFYNEAEALFKGTDNLNKITDEGEINAFNGAITYMMDAGYELLKANGVTSALSVIVQTLAAEVESMEAVDRVKQLEAMNVIHAIIENINDSLGKILSNTEDEREIVVGIKEMIEGLIESDFDSTLFQNIHNNIDEKSGEVVGVVEKTGAAVVADIKPRLQLIAEKMETVLAATADGKLSDTLTDPEKIEEFNRTLFQGIFDDIDSVKDILEEQRALINDVKTIAESSAKLSPEARAVIWNIVANHSTRILSGVKDGVRQIDNHIHRALSKTRKYLVDQFNEKVDKAHSETKTAIAENNALLKEIRMLVIANAGKLDNIDARTKQILDEVQKGKKVTRGILIALLVAIVAASGIGIADLVVDFKSLGDSASSSIVRTIDDLEMTQYSNYSGYVLSFGKVSPESGVETQSETPASYVGSIVKDEGAGTLAIGETVYDVTKSEGKIAYTNAITEYFNNLDAQTSALATTYKAFADAFQLDDFAVTANSSGLINSLYNVMTASNTTIVNEEQHTEEEVAKMAAYDSLASTITTAYINAGQTVTAETTVPVMLDYLITYDNNGEAYKNAFEGIYSYFTQNSADGKTIETMDAELRENVKLEKHGEDTDKILEEYETIKGDYEALKTWVVEKYQEIFKQLPEDGTSYQSMIETMLDAVKGEKLNDEETVNQFYDYIFAGKPIYNADLSTKEKKEIIEKYISQLEDVYRLFTNSSEKDNNVNADEYQS